MVTLKRAIVGQCLRYMDEEGQMEFLFEGGNIQKQTSLLICLDELAQRRWYLMGHTQSLGSL